MKTLKTKLLGLMLLIGFSINLQAQGVSATENVFFSKTDTEKVTVTTDATSEISAHLAKILEYPDELRALNVEGDGLVKITIDKEGKIVSKKIIKSLGNLFDQNIIKSLDKLEIVSPVYVNGVAKSYSIVVPIKYEK